MNNDDSGLERFRDAQERLVVQASDLSLRTLASMVASGTIDLEPVFQRRERWDPARQSALIESFLLNIPVPPLYLAEDELGKYQVIDGKQRLSSIAAYLTNQLKIRSSVRLPEFVGCRFDDLPPQVQHVLDIRPLRTVTLLRQSDSDLKHEVFHRLNTGGQTLNDQEIRNVIFRGPLNESLIRMSVHPFLRERLKITGSASANYQQMNDVEWVLRFLTLSESWQRFSGSLSQAMDAYMVANQHASDAIITSLERKFTFAIEACASLWGSHAFERPEGTGWRNQALSGVYDAEMIAVSEIGRSAVMSLQFVGSDVLKATKGLFDDRKFYEAATLGTNTPARILYRTTKLIDALRALV